MTNTSPDSPLPVDLNRRIEQAALQSEVDERAIKQLCDEAREYQFHAVVVNPVWVPMACGLLVGSGVRVVSVAGFPLGANRTELKVAEAAEAVEEGAQEIDMVANIGWIVSGRMDEVAGEIRKVRRQLAPEVGLKVIIEANKLTAEQQVAATKAVIDGGAQFVKTGTGFFGPATEDQVQRLAMEAKGTIEVKASGGIKTVQDALVMLRAGASRLGTSSGPAILRQTRELAG